MTRASLADLGHGQRLIRFLAVGVLNTAVGYAVYALLVLAESLRPQLGDATVRARVEAELAQLLDNVNAGLAPHERLHRLVVAREPWSIENGCLTPTMKIKRGRIEASAATQVDGWYAAAGTVVWA